MASSSLQHKDGFMAHFYLLSETISPTLVWGFLGTDTTLRARCLQFRVSSSLHRQVDCVYDLLFCIMCDTQ